MNRLKEGFARMGFMKKDAGIDGILVTVGLCIIALLLCVVMKDSLDTFIQTIMGELTTKASNILGGIGGAGS
ncbi:MAG: hypothetical protein NC092_04275 [Butyrivibrio sp.]|nr:hypothetical protein [Muribaculum sp.]MCM1551892.1 hypothetical protein [Butyrivibrio sp.]